MNCSKCNFQNEDSAKFCKNCGAELSVNCLKCNSKNKESAKFCQHCGEELNPTITDVACPKCGAKNEINAIFCVGCGGKLTAERKKKKKMPLWIGGVVLTFLIACGVVGAVGWYNARIRAENARIAEIEAEKREAVESHYEKGNEAFDEKLYDLAIANYSKALEIDPDFVKGYEGLALAYSSQRNYEFAIEYANKALSIDPDNLIAFRVLAWVNLEQKNRENALKYAQKALSIDPDNAWVYALIGEIYLYIMPSQPLQAVNNYKKSIQLDEQENKQISSVTYYNLASALMSVNKEEAMQYWQKIARMGGEGSDNAKQVLQLYGYRW